MKCTELPYKRPDIADICRQYREIAKAISEAADASEQLEQYKKAEARFSALEKFALVDGQFLRKHFSFLVKRLLHADFIPYHFFDQQRHNIVIHCTHHTNLIRFSCPYRLFHNARPRP